MGALSQEELDALACTLGRIKFSPSGASVDEFVFKVKRRGDTLLFTHGDIEVAVGDFKLVDLDGWTDALYPIVDRESRVIQYHYRAEVAVKIGGVKSKKEMVLGYIRDREDLLQPFGRSREREVADWLLLKIDKIAGDIFT